MHVSPNTFDPRPRVTILMTEIAGVSSKNLGETVLACRPDPNTDSRLPGQAWSEGGRRAMALIDQKRVKADTLLGSEGRHPLSIQQDVDTLEADVMILAGMLDAEFSERFAFLRGEYEWRFVTDAEFGIYVNLCDPKKFYLKTIQ